MCLRDLTLLTSSSSPSLGPVLVLPAALLELLLALAETRELCLPELNAAALSLVPILPQDKLEYQTDESHHAP